MTVANTKAKKEQRFAVIVPAGPTDTADVSKLLPAEPTSTKMAINCGIKAYLACRKAINYPSTSYDCYVEGPWRTHLSYT